MDHGNGRIFSVTKIVVSRLQHVDGGIRLSDFVLAGFIAGENVNLVDHGWIISVTVTRPVTGYIISSEYSTLVLGLGPFGFPSFWISTSNAKFYSV